MSFSDSDYSDKTEGNIKRIRKLNKTNKGKNKDNNYYDTINDLDDDEIRDMIKNQENEDDITNNKDIKNITKTYRYITKMLEDFIEKNYSNVKFVNEALKTIYSHIKIFLESFKHTKNKKDKKKENNNDENNNQKILYEVKINGLNQQIKELKHELELLNTNESNKFDSSSPRKFKIYNYLKKKNLKLENKTKIDEYKYLLCIEDQQKKINDLENKLKLKILENSEEVKESKLFPTISKFNMNQYKNVKSVPLTQSILKNSTSTKRNISKLPNKKNFYLTVTNYISKTPYKLLNESQKKEITKSKKADFKEKIYNTINISDKRKNINEKKSEKKNTADIHFKELKLNSEIIPNKDKNYFISHPNLTIAGYNNRLSKYKIGIPNKIFSFKFSKNMDKNNFYQFPSTLNEMFVELEKLRIPTNSE